MLEKISGIYKPDFSFLVYTDHSLLYHQCKDFLRTELTLLTSPRGQARPTKSNSLDNEHHLQKFSLKTMNLLNVKFYS